MTLVNVEPSSLVVVDDQCAAVERWAEQCQSIPELRDASHKLAAIDEYLSRTSTEGRARVAAAQRRLEVRIGTLLGPADNGGDRKSDQFIREVTELTPNERTTFRKMAEHVEIVEGAIAESTDEQPASRRKVMERVRASKPSRRLPLPATARRAAWELSRAVDRVERITTDDRFDANRDVIVSVFREQLSRTAEVVDRLMVHKMLTTRGSLAGTPSPESKARVALEALLVSEVDDAWFARVTSAVLDLAIYAGGDIDKLKIVCAEVDQGAGR